jgi:(p)ppGpp synthase/HD superfamily hydrolase
LFVEQVPFSYELRNGDVVSILTGEGKPAVDWMRFAKSRSTRSKLRSYFRRKQKESLREAGRILLTDYLWMHGPLIEKTSFLSGEWHIPTTVEELADFSKGRIQYEDIDDLLIDIGKRHDRTFLHNVVATLFQVPEKTLVEAEKNKKALVPTSVVVAVHESRQQAKDAAAAATADSEESDANSALNPPTPASSNFPKARNATTHLEKLLHGLEGTAVEFADHEQMCEDCLPVLGDEILGTRPAQAPDAVTTVHRIGCPHAQRAINKIYASKSIRTDLLGRVNSVSLRNSNKAGRYYGKHSVLASAPRNDVPVRLRWSDMPGEEQISFMTEVKIVAEDRKLLLADCSGVVSEMSEIVKTGSATTQEHAVLVFLVRVSGLDHLQELMDSLSQIRSVMSVERAVSLFCWLEEKLLPFSIVKTHRPCLVISLEASCCRLGFLSVRFLHCIFHFIIICNYSIYPSQSHDALPLFLRQSHHAFITTFSRYQKPFSCK